MNTGGLGWAGIFRLGLVQTALGSIVVLTTATINRVMVVELALAAMLPGALVGLHYGVQFMRPRFGHGSDLGGHRSPWIIGGMAVLAIGGISAALATAWMETNLAAGIVLATLAFVLVGLGVAASGTTLLALLAGLVIPKTSRCGGHHGLVNDDRRLCHHCWHRRLFSRPVLFSTTDYRAQLRSACSHWYLPWWLFMAWNAQPELFSPCPTGNRSHKTVSGKHWPRSGQSLPQDISPFSCLFPCWPTAPRIVFSSRLPDMCWPDTGTIDTAFRRAFLRAVGRYAAGRVTGQRLQCAAPLAHCACG